MSEEMMSNDERSAILKQVLGASAPKKEIKESINTPKKSSDIPEGNAVLSQPTFGELLEQSITIREGIKQEEKIEEKEMDSTREAAIGLSRMDILEGWNL